MSPRVYCIANIFHRKISQTIRKYILIPYVRSIFRYSSIRNRAITTENGKWPIVKIVVSNKYEKTNKTKIEREKKTVDEKERDEQITFVLSFDDRFEARQFLLETFFHATLRVPTSYKVFCQLSTARISALPAQSGGGRASR